MTGYDNLVLRERPRHEMDDYAVKLLAPALRVQRVKRSVIVGFRLRLNHHATMMPRAHAVATLYTRGGYD